MKNKNDEKEKQKDKMCSVKKREIERYDVLGKQKKYVFYDLSLK